VRPLPRRTHAAEYLDEPGHDPRELEESLGHVAAVNRWLGGTRAVLRHVLPLLSPDRATHILDVGTGAADIPRAIVHAARRRHLAVRIVAADVHPQILDIARRTSAAYPEITVERADALALPYPDDAFDIALLTLTLHHFEGEDQETALRELARVARRAIVVNELLRSRANYLGARLLAATVWRRNRLTRHDGPLSVLRAFTAPELLALARNAGLRDARVHRHFFQRLVLVAR